MTTKRNTTTSATHDAQRDDGVRLLLEAATATLRLWNKYGLGDDEAESEPVYQALVNAIATAKGLS